MSAKFGRGAAAALVVLALLFLLGLTELYRMRFAGGDLYPYASSFRADPLGAKVLHEALLDLPGVVVLRHQRALAEIAGGRDTVVLLLGLRPADVELATSPLLRDAFALASGGARVVLAFEPLTGEPWAEPPEKTPLASAPERQDEQQGERQDERQAPDSVPVRAQIHQADKPGWRFTTRRVGLPHDAEGLPAAALAKLAPELALSGLPDHLDLHTDLILAAESLDERSRVIYRRDAEPVVVERSVGRGSVAVIADGFLFANEGLSRDRQPALLSWALGEGRRVVFDESHLGVEERSGVMVLARRYRLLPLLSVLAVLAGLFVWRAASGLLPPPLPVPGGSHLAAGGDAASGLAKLLARGLDPRELLPLCAERWAEDCARGEKQATDTVATLARQARDPVTGYREIRAALATLPFRRGDHAD